MHRPIVLLSTLCIAITLGGCPPPPAGHTPQNAEGPAAPRPTDADGSAAFERGLAFIEREAWQQAVPQFDEVIQKKPTSSEAHYYRALANDRLGKREAAIAGYARSIELDANLINARLNLGAIYLEPPEQADKAIEVLTPAAKAAPNDRDVRENLAFAYRLVSNYDLSSQHYDAAIVIDDAPRLRFAFADMLHEAKRFDEMAVQLRAALPGFKGNKKHLMLFGQRFGKAKAWAECVDSVSLASALEPSDPAPHLLGGLCEQGRGDLEAARKRFRRALDLDAKMQIAWYHLARSFLAEKRYDEGLEALKEATAIDPNSLVGVEAQKLIEQFDTKP